MAHTLKQLTVVMALVGSFVASNAIALPILTGFDQGDGLWTTAGIDSEGREAEAQFTFTDDGFDIVLSSLASVTSVPNQVLVGIAFDLSITAIATDVTATGTVVETADISEASMSGVGIGTNDGSLTTVYMADHGDVLNGEWAFVTDVALLGEYVVSGSAYDPIGLNPVIDSFFAYTPPISTNGADFGIVAGDLSSLVPAVNFFAMDEVTIMFYTTDVFFDVMVTNVLFLYGTDGPTSVPEPSTVALLGTGLLALGLVSRRRRRTA